MAEKQNMESGQNYLVETNKTGFYNGFYGTFRRIEDENIVLDNATKLNVSSLAFGIDRGRTLEGEVKVSSDRIKFISAPLQRAD